MPSPDGSLCLILGWNQNDDPSAWLACSTPEEAQQFIHSRLPHLQIPARSCLAASPASHSNRVLR